MATTNFKQYRYYGNSASENNWNGIETIIPVGTVRQIGIQSIPGAQFLLNTQQINDKVTIGASGMFELDAEKTSLNIPSIKMITETKNVIDNNPTAYVLIDLVMVEE